MRDFEDLLIEEFDLSGEQWDALPEWTQHEKLREVFRVQNQSVWAASSRISDLEDAIIDANEELSEAESQCDLIKPILVKLRQNLLIDPCPGQLPIQFPKAKQQRGKRKSA